MMRGLIVWGLWIAVAAALAGPQRASGAPAAPTSGDASTVRPTEPVILEPIRPLLPNQTTAPIARARDCGSPEALMMSAAALFSLMLNLAPRRTPPAGKP